MEVQSGIKIRTVFLYFFLLAGQPEFDSGWGGIFLFTTTSRLTQGPSSLLSNGYNGSLLRGEVARALS
jgi:hypothetical protein